MPLGLDIMLEFGLSTFELRQFIWSPKKYVYYFWNYFDIGAYSFPIITSLYWLINESTPPVWLISLSNLTLNLKPQQDFSIDTPTNNNDPNNPWNLASKYYTLFANNGSYNQDSYIVQQPDDHTNMFAYPSSSLLAMYNFLSGNEVFGSWTLQNDPYLAILVVVFSFIVVVYLMNLFIGLLSNEIKHYNIQEAFLAEKAKIIIEIELFYLLPNQRRWRIDDIRRKIKEMDDSNEDPEYLPYVSDGLRKLVDMPQKQNIDSIDFNSNEINMEPQNNSIENPENKTNGIHCEVHISESKKAGQVFRYNGEEYLQINPSRDSIIAENDDYGSKKILNEY
ncbi:4659_t:CDS:2 [Entrophospora sp. SA101]|nr:4659_t:CDS:2 [Entrophospora sp. SA101]